MWYSLQVMILIYQVIMSVCSKYVSYYILIVYLQYIVVLSLLSCLHEETNLKIQSRLVQIDRCVNTWRADRLYYITLIDLIIIKPMNTMNMFQLIYVLGIIVGLSQLVFLTYPNPTQWYSVYQICQLDKRSIMDTRCVHVRAVTIMLILGQLSM